MAATVGNISIGFVANTSGFDASLRGLKRELMTFGKSVGLSENAIKGLSQMAVAGGAIIGAYAAAVKKAVDEIHRLDDIADVAADIGTTSNSLVGLQVAGVRAGTSAEGVVTGMKKMSKTIGAAKMGNTQAAASFRKLGLDANKLAKQDPAQTFRDIAEGFKGVKTQSEKAALAVEIFGKSGQDMLGVLALGAGGLDAMQRKAERLGLTMSDSEWSQIGELDDAFRDVGDALQGVTTQLTKEFLPELKAGAHEAIGLLATFREWIGPIKQVAGWIDKMNVMKAYNDMILGWVFGNQEKKGAEIAAIGGASKTLKDGIDLPDAAGVKLSPPQALEFGANALSQARKNTEARFGSVLEDIAKQQLEVQKRIADNTGKAADTRPPQPKLVGI